MPEHHLIGCPIVELVISSCGQTITWDGYTRRDFINSPLGNARHIGLVARCPVIGNSFGQDLIGVILIEFTAVDVVVECVCISIRLEDISRS